MRAPATIAGLIEVRGVGIVRVDALAEAPVALIVDLVAGGPGRTPAAGRTERLLAFAVPLIALAPFEASAAAKLRLALRALPPAEPDGSRLPASVSE